MKNTASSRASWAHRLVAMVLAAVAVALFTVAISSPAHAAEAASAAASATAPAPDTSALSAILGAFADKIPSWLVTAVSIFGTFSLAAQGFIGWMHKRAAETASPDDDAWIAKAEASTWFKVIDRIIYFGGYLGSWFGGKKL